MEELQKTQEYAAERERRRLQQPYEGDDRRKRASMSSPSTIPTPGATSQRRGRHRPALRLNGRSARGNHRRGAGPARYDHRRGGAAGACAGAGQDEPREHRGERGGRRWHSVRACHRELALARGGAPQASVWFSQEKKLDVAGAAQVNAVASDAAACDDSDLRSIAHIGTIVSTVSIAMAEHLGRGGREVLEAMVLGYEVAGRIDEALTPGRMKRGFHGSVSTIFGGAVAAGRLLGLHQARLAHAIALTASSACGMAIAADTSCGREYHAGLAAQLGVQAAFAAQRGSTSETVVLEAPRGFFQAMNGQAVEEVTRDWGGSWDITTDMAIKLMPGAIRSMPSPRRRSRRRARATSIRARWSRS